MVDPGEAAPVLQALDQLGLELQTILVTHHHADHVGGVAELRQATGAKVYGPAREKIPQPAQALKHGQQIEVLGLRLSVLDVPGHTAGHIAYHGVPEDGAPLLFCGDTLFSGGCGRLFEGTPAQMLASLDHHTALCESLRAQGQPTLPSTLAVECQINPFLRARVPAVADAAQRFAPSIDPTDAVAVFAALREWKNEFR